MSIFDTIAARVSVDEAPGDGALSALVELQTTQADTTLQADTGYTPREVKDACQELLKYGLLEVARKPNLYRTALAKTAEVNRILEPFDLVVKIDDIRGLAYLIVAQPIFAEGEDEWSHPLVRRQRLTLEQSLMVALLRQQYLIFEQERGVGAADAPIAVEDLVPQLQIYLGNLGSDTRELQRARTLLEKLKVHALVSEIDQQDQFVIRPIIVHLANPESLQGLLTALKDVGTAASPRADDPAAACVQEENR
ncbi:DUF4194 domain-containing protein (plasmid) [Cupriavidus pauculus]|uniref:DUF4194 domain-containing protein n=1 Tax=Cupriavidus pauculus TaxID=82633 RepID=A0A5P2H8G1_9BURK|nr:DUF4194 domain-containing protein [Cupriavidus pauculus]QET03914.1 DUF4194 domain-containing protein [Cupriavidus pauculus]